MENRHEYLQCLAQYRLATRCKPEVDAFLRGLNDLVPDNLLGIFDENELEVGSQLTSAQLSSAMISSDKPSLYQF